MLRSAILGTAFGLASIAAMLDSVRLAPCLRGNDIVARFGGEEFVVCLSATTREAAGAVAERLLRAVGDEPFAVAGITIPITVSIGAHWRREPIATDVAFRLADQALYQAKNAGRNRVVFIPGDHDSRLAAWTNPRAAAA